MQIRGWGVMVVIATLIIVPFLLWGDAVDSRITTWLEQGSSPVWLGVVMVGLLASDILLPIPSSVVSVAAGYWLGLWPGAVVSWVGMTSACLLGYELAARLGRPLVERCARSDDRRRMAQLQQRFGDWAIIIARPILAEASVLLAGLTGMPRARFGLFSALSNLGISLVYAVVGAQSMRAESFLMAFGASMLLPGLAMWLMKSVASTERSSL